MISDTLIEEVNRLVVHQLNNYWPNNESIDMNEEVRNALHDMEINFSACVSNRFYNEKGLVFDPYFSVTWMIFLYRLSHRLSKINSVYADKVYYLNKIMHSIDWYHAIELPDHFLTEHPLGTVLGRAKYGDYFFVYQGCTVGGNRKNGKLYYPTIGEHVVMYSNSSILGDSSIGNNVIISAGTRVINDIVPDNCIVFGQSPNLIIKKKNTEEINTMWAHIWKSNDN